MFPSLIVLTVMDTLGDFVCSRNTQVRELDIYFMQTILQGCYQLIFNQFECDNGVGSELLELNGVAKKSNVSADFNNMVVK